ncbi:hypothetical protein HQ524_03690 [Candidatus Uhrbacteria bacterium]|nr:hypothetical protein [Candidatus Uhrbacteria bacterium]
MQEDRIRYLLPHQLRLDVGGKTLICAAPRVIRRVQELHVNVTAFENEVADEIRARRGRNRQLKLPLY